MLFKWKIISISIEYFQLLYKKEGKKESEVAQSCPTLCFPMDCSLLGSSIHRIFQARLLKWVDISFLRVSSRPRDWTQVSHIAGRRFTIWATKGSPIWQMLLNAEQTKTFSYLISPSRIFLCHWETAENTL